MAHDPGMRERMATGRRLGGHAATGTEPHIQRHASEPDAAPVDVPKTKADLARLVGRTLSMVQSGALLPAAAKVTIDGAKLQAKLIDLEDEIPDEEMTDEQLLAELEEQVVVVRRRIAAQAAAGGGNGVSRVQGDLAS